MRRALFVPVLCMFALAGSPAAAQCYADYKARLANVPQLQLHYGVIQLPAPACGSVAAAEAEIIRRLAPAGWTLLNVMTIFGEEGLAERRQDAGEFYLRF